MYPIRIAIVMFTVLGCGSPRAAETPADAAPSPDAHPLATHLAYRLAGSGQWRTPNADFDPDDPNSPRQFGIGLEWAEGGQYVVGSVNGITGDGRTAIYQSLLILYDPAANEVIVQQVGWDGALAEGRQSLRRQPLGPGDVDRLDLRIVAEGRPEHWLRHEDHVIDDDHYRSVVYELRDDEWIRVREWLWTRVPVASPGGAPRPCREDCQMLEKKILVRAPLERVWNAWTTEEGLRFVSAESNVRMEVGGPYEWFLDLPADANGIRGSEGSRVRAVVPQRMIAFDWMFPPDTPTLRAARATTTVVVVFDEVSDDTVQVNLQAVGWQPGEEWRRGWHYFDAAWESVLERLKSTLEAPEEPDSRG